MSASREPLAVRAATAVDLPAILELLAASMARPDDERFAALYAWKHAENPFGASPGWIAVDGDRIAGVRVFMRWEFHLDGARARAVRAVDTATHPDYQGRGVFTMLTTHALDEMRAEGVDFVFNTPNEQSRPGYLKMGWQVVGRLPVVFRPVSPAGLARLARARVPASHWSEESTAGVPATDVLGAGALDALLATIPVGGGLATVRSPEFLRWRYGTPLLRYRALARRGRVEDGVAFFRVRRRGPAREAALCDVLVPGGDPGARRALLRELRRGVDADYVVGIAGRAGAARDRMLPLPGQGPTLTWRAVATDRAAPPPLDQWRLTLGDVELF